MSHSSLKKRFENVILIWKVYEATFVQCSALDETLPSLLDIVKFQFHQQDL